MRPLREALQTARDKGILTPSDRILVALSGGADSCALLLALDADPEVSVAGVAHFHHGMRGEDADADAAFCAALSIRLGFSCAIELGADSGKNEAEARKSRYDFLIATARELGANTIATAHTADDVAETVLLRIFRGTGLDGLSGIPPRRQLAPQLDVVRPILDARRSETEAACRNAGIAFRQDPTNDNSRYPRNRLRAQLPQLADDFNPALVDALNRLAENARADAEILTRLAARLIDEARIGDGIWRVETLLAAPTAFRHRALRHAIWQEYDHDQVLRAEADTHAFVRRLETLLPGGALTLPGNVTARSDGRTLSFTRATTAETTVAPYCLPLPVPGTCALPGEIGEIVVAFSTFRAPQDHVRHPLSIDLPISFADSGLIVRTVRDGERMAVFGLGGKTKGVRELLREAKVPKERRGVYPLVARSDNDEIVWIPGVEVSEQARLPGRPSSVGPACLRLDARLSPDSTTA